MSTPINHYIIITERDGNQIGGKVIYVLATINRHYDVHILTSIWLDTYHYRAIYNAPSRAVPGTYIVAGHARADGQWLFRGVFEPDEAGET